MGSNIFVPEVLQLSDGRAQTVTLLTKGSVECAKNFLLPLWDIRIDSPVFVLSSPSASLSVLVCLLLVSDRLVTACEIVGTKDELSILLLGSCELSFPGICCSNHIVVGSGVSLIGLFVTLCLDKNVADTGSVLIKPGDNPAAATGKYTSCVTLSEYVLCCSVEVRDGAFKCIGGIFTVGSDASTVGFNINGSESRLKVLLGSLVDAVSYLVVNVVQTVQSSLNSFKGSGGVTSGNLILHGLEGILLGLSAVTGNLLLSSVNLSIVVTHLGCPQARNLIFNSFLESILRVDNICLDGICLSNKRLDLAFSVGSRAYH